MAYHHHQQTMQPRTGQSQTGLTLIELMVTLAVGAIVVTMATPISNLMKRNQTTTNLHEFITTLNFARSEAITRGNNIVICRANPADQNACAVDAVDPIPWEQGWVVFTDTNLSGGPDAGEILRRHGPLSGGYTLRVSGRNAITYDRIGLARDSIATWSLCDKTEEVQFKRGVQLAVTGKVNLVDGATVSCSPP